MFCAALRFFFFPACAQRAVAYLVPSFCPEFEMGRRQTNKGKSTMDACGTSTEASACLLARVIGLYTQNDAAIKASAIIPSLSSAALSHSRLGCRIASNPVCVYSSIRRHYRNNSIRGVSFLILPFAHKQTRRVCYYVTGHARGKLGK